jgi:hypothetical protein
MYARSFRFCAGGSHRSGRSIVSPPAPGPSKGCGLRRGTILICSPSIGSSSSSDFDGGDGARLEHFRL